MVYRRGLDRILNGIGSSSGFGLKQRWKSPGSGHGSPYLDPCWVSRIITMRITVATIRLEPISVSYDVSFGV